MSGIIQIIPRLPPVTSGVGDYALRLAQEWRQTAGSESEFLVTDANWPGEQQVDGFRVHRLEQRSAVGLANFLNSASARNQSVLLHYVGYAYARRGAPLWLLQGFRAWRRAGWRGIFGVYFHELFASGSPWTSAFWLSPVQRWICRELAGMAPTRFTNRATSAGWLDQRANDTNLATWVLPVFSNLGEPSAVPPLAERPAQLVIYGGVSRHVAERTVALQHLRQAIDRLGLTRVVTFGPRPVSETELGVPVENFGVLPMEKVSLLLLNSRVGYLDYFDGYLGKSTVFAAFCAHGLAPLLACINRSEPDGLIAGKHFLSAREFGPESLPLQSIADAARAWYGGHSIEVTARVMAEALAEEKLSC